MSKKKKILVLAGGGCYGFLQALFLNSIYIDDIRNYVDFISGCSIGGINALSLAEGNSSEKLMDFYFDYCSQIFDTSEKEGLIFKTYNNEIYNSILQKALTKKYSELEIPCIIPALDFNADQLITFENITKIDNKCFEWMNWQIARATSSAPTYFAPFGRNDNEVIVDGGLCEVIPVIDTVTTIKPLLNIEFNEMDVFVIGTGSTKKDVHTLSEVTGYNPIDWLTKLLIPYTTMANETTTIKWSKHLGFNSFVYFNPVEISGKMEDANQVTDGTLYNASAPYFNDFKDKFLNFIKN